ncbi:MAG: sigma-70 family RNA polymerase sigma factor [Phycisphaeraceae bacterium]|nr:sigma-70 family RNA polymerase sigma factor [Phycisphaeraceae bacterium]
MEDRLLVLRCRRGGIEAMARIYQKYRKDLLILAMALLNDKAVAEDIVHDVFVAFAESVRTFRLTGSLRAYLMTCVANRARNHNKTKRPQDAPNPSKSRDRQVTPGPVEHLVCNEQLGRLAEAMDKLPYGQREILMLHMYGGLSLRAVARTRGLSANTVMSRYRYGIGKLRGLLNGEYDHEI